MKAGRALPYACDLCLWCAHRAVAFVAISMGCPDHLKGKVRFDHKGTFAERAHWNHPETSVPRMLACRGRLPGFDHALRPTAADTDGARLAPLGSILSIIS